MFILKRISFCIGISLCSVFSHAVSNLVEQTQIALSHIYHQNIPKTSFHPCSSPQCLSFSNPSASHLQFFIQINPSETTPSISFDSSSKTLTLPSLHFLTPSSKLFSEELLKQFLVGHTWHPYSGKKSIMRESQNTALQAFHQALDQKAQGFLLIAPTGTGKTSVLAQALLSQVQKSDKKIFIVTVHRVQLVNQLFSHIQEEKEKLGLTHIHTINWNQPQPEEKNWEGLSVKILQALEHQETLILVMTSQSLKARLNDFQVQNKKYGVYTNLIQNLGGVYIDEAHHLGAYQTKEALQKLIQESKAFLYGTTATPYHHQVELDEFFERKHWAYLNFENNLFESHSIEKIVEQLHVSINKGDITPFDDLYIIGENSFLRMFSSSEQESHLSDSNKKEDQQQEKSPLFIQKSTPFYVLNPQYYESLNQILSPLFKDNLKGFIAVADIEEAESIAEFLSQKRPEMVFTAYHSKISQDERKAILKRSKESQGGHYIVAVNALNEGVDLPHLSAYIDLNSSISIKERMHRIGRTLRIHPGKIRADILFLINYENAEMIEDTLKILDLVERTSFKGNRERKRKSLSQQEEKEVQLVNKKDLLEMRRLLRDSVRQFWETKEITDFINNIPQWVREYQKLHPDINLNTINFDDHREKIHPDMPKIQTIKKWYRQEHGHGQGFADWLFSRQKRRTLSLETIKEKVKEYQRRHLDINLHTENFDDHREKIHPDMPKIQTIKKWYRQEHGHGQGFADWLFSRKKRRILSLETIKERVKEYQKLHPDINLNTINFDDHREKIHPNMPTIKTIQHWYRIKHINTKGFMDWLFSRKKRHIFSVEEILERVEEYQKRHPNINLHTKNFDDHREKIHPNIPKIESIKDWYKKEHGNLQGFADWLFSREKKRKFSLKEIREKTEKYQRRYPDINLSTKNFNDYREKIHLDMPKIESIRDQYRIKHGNGQGFADWLFSRECENTIQNSFN